MGEAEIGAVSGAVEATGHARGDETGVLMPAHEAALRLGGAAFLTRAFHAFGSISPANSVTRITRLEPCPGGSTGHKLFLSVAYALEEPGLQRDLFVKFSRDFTDSGRDHARHEMESEARFASVSRTPGFPIHVPRAYFGDFDHASGTGLLITARVAFGRDGIEPQREKCRDHEIDDPLPYYRALIAALARLAAAHKAGRLTADMEQRFPFDPAGAGVERVTGDATALRRTVEGCRQFAADLPQLLPPELRAPEFYDRVLRDVLRIGENRDRLAAYLLGNRDLIALCHWNAHIDNAWFWRDDRQVLHCGLLDWGGVAQITFGSALWGCLSAAHAGMLENDLDALLMLFLQEYRAQGGAGIDAEELKRHFFVHVGVMGAARVLALHKVLRRRLPGGAPILGPHDPLVAEEEGLRTVLHIYTVLLTLWSKADLGAALDHVLGAEGGPVSPGRIRSASV